MLIPLYQNKHELADERKLDDVLDSLYELNPETPKLRISRTSPPAPSLIFGLLAVPSTSSNGERKESKVFGMQGAEAEERKRLGLLDGEHASEAKGEVETVSIWRGGQQPDHGHEGHSHSHTHPHDQTQQSASTEPISKDSLEPLLGKLPAEDIWRVKGFLLLSGSYYILNWAFGRHELHEASAAMSEKLKEQEVQVRLTMMGARGEVKKRARILAQGLGASVA